MARTINGARTFLVDGGIIYLVLWIYGLLIKSDSLENFPPVNTADNWLHFALGAGIVLLWSWSTANATPVLTGWRLPSQFSADDLRAERAALDLRRILADCLRIDCAISRVSRALRRVAAAWVRIAVRFAARSRSLYAFWRQAPEQ
jgi:hypothetical protein